jgi:hypothetical protein
MEISYTEYFSFIGDFLKLNSMKRTELSSNYTWYITLKSD